MVVNTRGQFFILAAVIISAIVFSFAFTANEAKFNREPESFKDLSYEIKKETGEVIDYQIYSGFQNDQNLSDFVEKLADDIYDKDSGINFLFVYGNRSNLSVSNYGSKDVRSGNENVQGATKKTISSVTLKGVSTSSSQPISVFNSDNSVWSSSFSDVDSIDLEVSGQNFSFPISSYKQVIVIIQKDVNDESYLSIK